MKNWMCPLSEIQPDYNFLLGYHTGKPKEWYCGIKGITFIFMGYWNDPMIGYKEYAFNEPWYTDGLYAYFNEETGKDTVEEFAIWLKDHSYLLIDYLDEAIAQYEEEEERRMKNDQQRVQRNRRLVQRSHLTGSL